MCFGKAYPFVCNSFKALTFAPPSGASAVELGRAFGHPRQKARNPGMRAQRRNRAIVPRQFGLGKDRVDFAVANLVEQNHRTAFAAFQLWDQVVQALLGPGRNRAQTQRAYRIIHGLDLCLTASQGKTA